MSPSPLRRCVAVVCTALSACATISSVVVACGCSAMTRGGAPEPTANLEKDLAALETQFGAAASIDKVYEGGATSAKRDEMIAARLVMMNLRYLAFIRQMNAQKQFIDAASDILILSLNLAGTAFADATTKTVLAALSAGTAGSRVSIDKHYYYEKTMPALVASMNAQRKTAMLPLVRGLGTPLEEYKVEQALTDLDAYYHAGTLIGAINAIHVDAAARDKAADKELNIEAVARVSSLISAPARSQVQAIGDAIDQINEAQLEPARKAIRTLLPAAATEPIATSEDAKRLLRAALRRMGRDDAQIATMHSVLKTNGLIK